MTQKTIRIAMVLVLTFLAAALAAQTVNKITVVPRPTPEAFSDEFVRGNLSMTEGSAWAPEKLSEDIKALYDTGRFADVQAKVEYVSEDKVDIVYVVQLLPRVGAINFAGNFRRKDKLLRKRLNLESGAPFSDQAVAADKAALLEYYAGKGFTNVVITPEVEPVEGRNYVDITYVIDEGVRVKTRGIDIEGNKVLGDREIRKLMRTDVSLWGYILPTGWFDEQQLQQDIDLIHERYRALGYLDARVTRYELDYNDDKDKVVVTLYIVEGEPYTVGNVEIVGAEQIPQGELEDLVALSAGQTFDGTTMSADLKRISNYYNARGYLDSRVRSVEKAQGEVHTVDLTYAVHEGRPVNIRNITITGNQVTHDNVIRRELTIHPGDLGDRTKIDTSRQRLQNLGYFRTVEIVDLQTDSPAEKDLKVTVEEQETGRLLFAAGFSSVDNVLGTVEVAQTNFDLTGWPSFRGAGQRFRLRTTIGESRSEYSLSFTEPWLLDMPLRFDYDLWRRETSSNREFDETSLGTSFSLTRQMETWPSWRQYVSYRIEQAEISDIDDDYSAAFRNFEEGEELISAFGLGLLYDRRDSFTRPTHGSYLRVGADLQSEAWGSYSDLATVNARANTWVPVFKRSVFRLGGEITQVIEVGGDKPRIWDRLFAGGLRSIRGFAPREVGPVDPGNLEPVGGETRILANAELTSPLYQDQIYWAAWADSGNVWEDELEYDFGQINVGAGIGLRFYLQAIVFSIDYGWPIVREWDHLDSDGRLHFNVGYSF